MEREYQNQPAGLRTHIILVIGATLAMTLSINLPYTFSNVAIGDPGRIAAQVVSGIGFLGAGAIFRFGPNIKGLTTATSLWSMAIVGLCVGAGYFYPAVATTAFLLIILTVINRLEEHAIQAYIMLHLSLKADDRIGLLKEIKQVIAEYGDVATKFSVKKNMEEKRISIDIVLRTQNPNALDELMEDIGDIEGVRSFEIA
ncbi:MAG: MgtC/SapB family protein [Anaerolineaceae bacterium]|nr:MgtC/SapB family protein [Anaerolineaceae bacterium]